MCSAEDQNNSISYADLWTNAVGVQADVDPCLLRSQSGSLFLAAAKAAVWAADGNLEGVGGNLQ